MNYREHVQNTKNRWTFEKEGMQGLREALEDEDEKVRQMAALFLGGTGNESIVENLIGAFYDTEKAVRARAVDGLVKIGSAAVNPLISVLQVDEWIVRYRAAEALGRIGDIRAHEPLIRALSDRKDHVRYMAAKGLGNIADDRSTEPLINVLRDENEYVRRSAVKALGKIGNKKAYDALLSALNNEDCTDLKDVIRKTLEIISKEY
jgi:HEAT repeat protein